MELIRFFSEIQANPNNLNAYRQIIEVFERKGMENEANAFKEMLSKKYGIDSTNSHQK